MKVDRVTATIRYSQDTGRGAWKSIEVGAEAQVAPHEDWHVAQEQLYLQLGQQMKALWANGNGKTAVQEPAQPETTAPPAREHWCTEHNTEFKRFSKDGRTWYSHKTGGTWHKEN